MPASGSLSRTKALIRRPPLWTALHPVASDPDLDSTTRESRVQTLDLGSVRRKRISSAAGIRTSA